MHAMLKMRAGKDCWDQLTLFIEDADVHYIYWLKDRFTCLELCRQLYIPFFEDFQGDVTVCIHGQVCVWRNSIWRTVLSVVDQWYEEYMFINELD